MTKAPTATQLALLRYIIGYIEAHGYGPSADEMSRAFGRPWRGNFTAGKLDALERLGYIRRLPYQARALGVLRPVAIPRAPDGSPLYAVPLAVLSAPAAARRKPRKALAGLPKV